jgi:uncharacterized peroxidase-related enzyme
MRLGILDRGHGLGTKALFAIIRAASRQPVLDIIKLVKYRADFYGGPASKLTHEAMRGPSAWSVGDRELMAAFVAQINESAFCKAAHSAVAKVAYRSDARVDAVLADLDSAEIDDKLRATLRMLRQLTRQHTVGSADMREVLDAGVTREQIEDALNVAFSFNIITRLSEAFDFAIPTNDAMNAGAKFLLARGYR